MFTLRKITGDGAEMNFYLGKSYTLITKERNPNEFKETCNLFKYNETDNVYGFISDEDGKSIGLFSTQQSYVMTSGGKTYDNLTHLMR